MACPCLQYGLCVACAGATVNTLFQIGPLSTSSSIVFLVRSGTAGPWSAVRTYRRRYMPSCPSMGCGVIALMIVAGVHVFPDPLAEHVYGTNPRLPRSSTWDLARKTANATFSVCLRDPHSIAGNSIGKLFEVVVMIDSVRFLDSPLGLG